MKKYVWLKKALRKNKKKKKKKKKNKMYKNLLFIINSIILLKRKKINKYRKIKMENYLDQLISLYMYFF